MLAEIQYRVRLIVKSRWILLTLLAVYGIYAGGFLYFNGNSVNLQPSQIIVLGWAIAIVVSYNLFYHYFYRELSHFLFTNHIQIVIDILFVTIIVHFSGGALSWFWTVYLILTLESAFLLERRGDVWFIGATGGIIYGALLTAEYYNIIPPVIMPFVNHGLQHDFAYVMIIWFWVSIMNATVAIIGAFLMNVIRGREKELKLMVIKDQMTKLYNRSYFFKVLNSEIQRSRRYDHVFSVLLLDIDDFKKYNDTYGHLEGDRLLKAVTQVFHSNVRRSETEPPYDVDIPCRYGGEEFAIILPETPPQLLYSSEQSRNTNAMVFAERIRRGIQLLEIDGHGTTVSIGVAAYPIHGRTADELVKAADYALYQAKREGKNKVILAQQ